MYVYFPSCNFRRIFPETAAKVETWLNTREDLRIAGCCHVTGCTLRPGDVPVTVCMSCMHMLTEEHPDLRHLNLFEYLLAQEDFPWPDLSGQAFTV